LEENREKLIDFSQLLISKRIIYKKDLDFCII
jgi:hypothetical protein